MSAHRHPTTDSPELDPHRVKVHDTVSAAPDEAARARAIATRQLADATRRSLEGRLHSDSAELVAEDRLR
jgi:hypothetical protein